MKAIILKYLYSIVFMKSKRSICYLAQLPYPSLAKRKEGSDVALLHTRQVSNGLWERKTQDGGQNWIAEEKSSRLAKREGARGSEKGRYSTSIDWWRRKVSYYLGCFWYLFERSHVALLLERNVKTALTEFVLRWLIWYVAIFVSIYVLRVLNVIFA